MEFSDLDHTMDALRDALKRALESGELFDQQMQDQIDEMSAEGKLDELIETDHAAHGAGKLHLGRATQQSFRECIAIRTRR